MPWDPVKKQWRSQRDIDLDRRINDELGTPEERNIRGILDAADPATLRALVEEMRFGTKHPLKDKLLRAEHGRIMQVNNDMANVTGADRYNPGSFPPDVPNWNTPTQSNEQNTFRGPAGIPSRWRKPLSQGGSSDLLENYPKTWGEMLQNYVDNNIPASGDDDNARVRKVMGMIGPSSMGILGGTMSKMFPRDAATNAVKEAISMNRPNADTFALTLPQYRHLWDKYRISIGAEGAPRYEIPGSPRLIRTEGEFSDKLANIMDWDALYKAYPALARAKVNLNILPDFGTHGAHSVRNGASEMTVYAPNARGALSTLVHETTHAVQNLQPTWAKGGNPRQMFADELSQASQNPYAPHSFMSPEETAYRRLAGEVEARASQRRLLMTDAEKQTHPPMSSEDVPREFQLLRLFSQ